MAAPPGSSRGGGGVDRLSHEILAQILSFLPAQVAARTCVLARSWRDVWKLTRRLRITGTAEPESVREVRGFVDHLLGLRLREIQHAPLDACEIAFHGCDDKEDWEDDDDDVERWISRAPECEIQTLQVDMLCELGPLILVAKKPLVSSHLTRLVLRGVGFSQSFADFSSCSVLKDLEIQESDLWNIQRMRSPSLKHLSITGCSSNSYSRIRISAPSLVSLWLDCPCVLKTPVLEGMPELVSHLQIFEFHDENIKNN